MRIRLTLPKEHVDEDTLGRALEASTAVAQKQLQTGTIPPLEDAIEQGLVKWKPEPASQGFEGFDLPKDVLARGWGDCDDLAAWWAAELRESGADPDAMPIVYQSGKNRWHAIVQRGNGDLDDPSQWAGMGKPGSPLPVTDPMHRDQGGFSTVGFKRLPSGAAKARWDVPLYRSATGHVVGVAIERAGDDFLDALSRLSSGALSVLALWGAPEDVLVRMHAIAHMLTGGSEEDFASVSGCGYDECGDFVGALAHRVGAAHADIHVNPSDVANIAATIFDPLGIRNMVAPLAQSFVSSYAQGLAHRGEDKSKKKSDDKTVSGPRYERVGSLLFPMPGSGGGGSRGGGSARGGSRGGSRGRGGSSRGSGSGSGSGSRSPGAGPSSPSRQVQPSDQGGGYGGYDDSAPDWSAWDAQFGVDPSTGLPYAQPSAYPPGYGGYGGFSPQYPYAPAPPPPSYYAPPAYFAPQVPAYGPQSPMYGPPPAGGFDPNTPGVPDLVKDPYGGYATPTAFSKYWQAWVKEQPHSAFDDTIMTGDDALSVVVPGGTMTYSDAAMKTSSGRTPHDAVLSIDQVKGDALRFGLFWVKAGDVHVSGDEIGQTTTEDAASACPPGWHWEERGSVLICAPNVHGHDYAES